MFLFASDCSPSLYQDYFSHPKWRNRFKVVQILSVWNCMCALNRVPLFPTQWAVAHQAPLSMVFSSQEYWSGLPFPTLKRSFWPHTSNLCLLHLLHWQEDFFFFFTTSPSIFKYIYIHLNTHLYLNTICI